MTPSDIWKDPVWSKVIANFIWVVMAALILLLTGRRKAGEYDLFRIINVKFPAWYLLLGINIFFIAVSLFPSQSIVITISMLTIVLLICISRYRKIESVQLAADEATSSAGEMPIYCLNDAVDHSLEFSLEKYYENNQPVGDKASGSFQFGPDRIINIQRTTKDGRAIVHIKRYLGNNRYRVNKDLNRDAKRVIQVVFEAKVSAGMHKLWFVAKKDGKPDWIHNGHKWQEITNTHWQEFRLHFYVPSDEDFTLFFEDREITVAPSSVQIKNLEIFEPED